MPGILRAFYPKIKIQVRPIRLENCQKNRRIFYKDKNRARTEIVQLQVTGF